MKTAENHNSQFISLFSRIDKVLGTDYSKILTELYGEYEKMSQKNSEYEATIFANIKVQMKEVKHSKIIAAILKNENCMLEFFEILNASQSILNNSLNINKNNYKLPIVSTGQIDIQIRDDNSKNTIIIENKIKGAPDKDNQLKRYYDERIEKGYTVDAVVYLVPDENRKPVEWEKFPAELKEKLIIFPILSKNTTNNSTLLEFLSRCKTQTKNSENEILNSTIIQYELLAQRILKEYLMTKGLRKKIVSLLKNGYSINELMKFMKFGQDIESLIKEDASNILLEKVSQACGDKIWKFYSDEPSIYQELEFKSNIGNMKSNVIVEIGLAIDSENLIIYSYLMSSDKNNFAETTFDKFMKKLIKDSDFLKTTDMSRQSPIWYTYTLVESDDHLSNYENTIMDYMENWLIRSIEKLKKLPTFVK